MDFNFRNPPLPGRARMSREEEEALKEQRHRQALALLEVARQQQSDPLSDGGFASPLGRSLGAQQIGGPGAVAAVASGLGPKKISNAGFASLQRNAPSVAEINNSRALNVPFGGGAIAASAPAPTQRDIGGNQTVSDQQVNTAFSRSDDKEEFLKQYESALLQENISPGFGESVLIGDGSTRIVTAGGVDPNCSGNGEVGGCSVTSGIDQQFPGVVAIQERDVNGKWQFIDDARIARPPKGGSAYCEASRDNPRGFCREIPAFVINKEV